MINIGIIGVGGVGGYLAAMLSNYYEQSNSVAIHLYARGETAEVLKRDGVTLTSSKDSDIIRAIPSGVYCSSDDTPIMDYLFVCVKSYSVDSIIDEVKRCTDQNSVIIPMMNGVDGRERLIELLPARTIIDGCVYIISKIISPGVIEIVDYTDRTLYFYGGYNDKESVAAKKLENILKPACKSISAVDNIGDRVWQKFLRISTASTMQSFRRVTNGGIKHSVELRDEMKALVSEFMAVAEGLGHKLPDNSVDTIMHYVDIVPETMTTSMQRDFQDGKETELETITGYIVKKGRELGLNIPLYEMMYQGLLSYD